MPTIQQSIEIRVPVHAAYHQLTRFEDYPRFMDEVEAVQRLDDTHLHWTSVMSNRPVEWDAEIIEQEPDRCIAWRNVSGPTNAGKVELQPLASDRSRVVFTLESRPEQVPGSPAGDSEQEMAQRLKLDLARLKDFIEAHGAEAGAQRGDIQGRQAEGSGETADPQQGRGSPRNSPVPTSSYAAGSEGFAGAEEPTAPVTSSARTAAEQRNDSAGSARHVGQMPQDTSAQRHDGTPTSDATGKSTQQEPQDAAGHGPATGSAALQSQPERGHQAGAGRAVDGGTGVGGTAAAAGAAGGTDAAAGARMAGGPVRTGDAAAPGGAATAGTTQPANAATAGGGSAAAGAAAAGGTSLGGADMGADAGDTRAVPREGTTGAAGGTTSSAGKGSGAKKS
jgi:hypothetical protein